MENYSFGIKNFESNGVNPYYHSILRDHNENVQINKLQFKKLVGLSRTSLKVLEYFISHHNTQSEIVYFNLKQCISYTGFSNKRSVYNALTELLGEQFIARSKNENAYYLNTSIVISGRD